MTELFIGLQICVGLAVFGGAFWTLTHSVDAHTPVSRQLLFVSMLVAGAWYAIEPLVLGVPTSTKPGIVFAGFCAWVMLSWQRTLASAANLG